MAESQPVGATVQPAGGVSLGGFCSLPLKKGLEEFPLWLGGLRARHSVCEGGGSVPGLAQWVKDLALP